MQQHKRKFDMPKTLVWVQHDKHYNIIFSKRN